jgi:hypothetical protein
MLETEAFRLVGPFDGVWPGIFSRIPPEFAPFRPVGGPNRPRFRALPFVNVTDLITT